MGWVGIEPTCRSHGFTARCPTIRASNPDYSGREYRTRTCACRNQNPMPYQLGELPTVTLIVLSALFAMLNGISGRNLPYLYIVTQAWSSPWLTDNTIKVSSYLFSTQALDWAVTLSKYNSFFLPRCIHAAISSASSCANGAIATGTLTLPHANFRKLVTGLL